MNIDVAVVDDDESLRRSLTRLLRAAHFHKSNIMDKVGVRTTADLTQYAIKRGLISFQSTTSDGVPNEASVR